jgi:uncharacterized protein YndB with AHSA1/START domain
MGVSMPNAARGRIRMEIQRDAPVVAEYALRLDVSATTVWKVMADVERWAAWLPRMTKTRLAGPLLIGAGLRWRWRGVPLTGRLRDVDKPHRLTWTGRTLGASTIHVWEIEATGERSCEVRSRHSLDGWLVRWTAARLGVMVAHDAQAWMEALQRRVRGEVPCG